MQSTVAQMDLKAVDPTVFALLESFEVSIRTDGQAKTYSTRSGETGKLSLTWKILKFSMEAVWFSMSF